MSDNNAVTLKSTLGAGRMRSMTKFPARPDAPRPPSEERLAVDIPPLIERAQKAAAEGDLTAIAFLGGEVVERDNAPYGSFSGEEKCFAMLERLARQLMPYLRIARVLTEAGFKARHGGEWRAGAVRRIVKREWPELSCGKKRGRPKLTTGPA